MFRVFLGYGRVTGGLLEGWLFGSEQALIDQKVKLFAICNVTIYPGIG